MSVCIEGNAGGPLERKNRFVMVVDSDANDVFYVSMLLQRFDYNVCTAKSAAEARDLLLVAVPALMLISSRLPDVAGADLCRELRKDARSATVPMILMVPEGDVLAEKQGREAGARDSLSTPVSAEDLYRVVQAVLETTPRRNIRINVNLPITMNGVSLDCKGGECASVLSEHGMYVRTLRPAAANVRIALQFTLQGRSISADAIVLYSHTYGQGPFKEPGMGVKFVRISNEDREVIREYINKAITSGLSS